VIAKPVGGRGRRLRRRADSSPPPAEAPFEAAAIDALYGLDPILEPGSGASELSDFVTIGCPYCGEHYGTPVDLTAGSVSYVEDCQVCCQPIEIGIEIAGNGTLERVSARRLD
jgi:hypothetical protein